MSVRNSLDEPLAHSYARAAHGRRISQPVCLVDLAPTILEAMDADPASHRLHGRSLIPLLQGASEDPEAIAVCEWNGIIQNMFRKHEMFADVKDQHFRSIRTRRWKLNLPDTDLPELYDLDVDPAKYTTVSATRVAGTSSTNCSNVCRFGNVRHRTACPCD